jgi:hypothetical protein
LDIIIGERSIYLRREAKKGWRGGTTNMMDEVSEMIVPGIYPQRDEFDDDDSSAPCRRRELRLQRCCGTERENQMEYL